MYMNDNSCYLFSPHTSREQNKINFLETLYVGNLIYYYLYIREVNI